jgi:alcohol dehydrogenase
MFLETFDYHPRTRVVFGVGSLSRLGVLARESGANRILLVTDPGIVEAGHAPRAREILEDSTLDVILFDGVEENPTARHVEAGVEVARENRVDFIVGIGGGSSLDCAKGINFVYTSGGSMKDYWGVGKAKNPMLPMIAVPTTGGTGSECQSFALIADPETHQKMACGDKKAACGIALLDPELTATQPRAVTAATGIDAISHAVESLVTRRRTPFSRMLSVEAWRLLAASYERVLEVPGDLAARGKMLLGASLAGAAIENSMLGAAHSAVNPLTARYGIVHGQAIGILLPHVVRFNAQVVGDVYRELELERAVPHNGGGIQEALAMRLEALYAASGLPVRLRDYGVEEEALGELAADAKKQWTAQFNPRAVEEDDFAEFYRCAL